MFNITYGNIKRTNTDIIIPISYNSDRFLVKMPTTECVLFEKTYIALRGEAIESFITKLEEKIIYDLKKLGKKWELPNNLKYVSMITEYHGNNIIKFDFNDVIPVIYNSAKQIVSSCDKTEGNIKSLIEIKDLIINTNTKHMYISVVVHQLQFEENSNFTQITDYVLSESD